MRAVRIGFGLALATLAGAAPAFAADWDRPSRSKRVAVPAPIPVPAPVPVVEHFKWYVRADFGIGLMHAPNISESGLLYAESGGSPLSSTAPFGMSGGWYDDLSVFVSGGIGFGAYLTPRLRGDITLEARTPDSHDASGSYSYELTAAPGTFVIGTVRESVDVRNTVALANLYWDLSQRGVGVTPYVGAGVGFAYRGIRRQHTTSEVEDDGTPPPVGLTPYTGSSEEHKFVPAAALMAGLAWSLTPGTVIDLNYRFTWLGSAEINTAISNGTDTYSSRLKLGDTFDHQLRAGLRWNVW